MGDSFQSARRWFHLTPDRLIVGLLAVEGLLWLSARFGWLPWHKGYAVLTGVVIIAAALVAMLLWFTAALLFHWRFQYGIRSLLVLTVAVAIPSSWLAVAMKQARGQKAAIRAIEAEGGQVAFGDYVGLWPGSPIVSPGPPGPAWLRELLIQRLGDDFFREVVRVSLFYFGTDAALEHVEGFAHLYSLDLSDAEGVTGAGLEHLKGLRELHELGLGGTNVTDAGLEQLKWLVQLEMLNLGRTQVTDSGLEHLKGLAHLRSLWLDCTEVTDAGLEHLKGLNQLQELCLNPCDVTDEGVKKLQQALPNCHIDH